MLYKIKNVIKRFFQRRTRGFDDSELWNLDNTITEFILPRLKAFNKYNDCYPNEFTSVEEWQWVVNSMIWSFQYHLDHEFFLEFKDNIDEERYQRGMEFFAQYFGHLWN